MSIPEIQRTFPVFPEEARRGWKKIIFACNNPTKKSKTDAASHFDFNFSALNAPGPAIRFKALKFLQFGSEFKKGQVLPGLAAWQSTEAGTACILKLEKQDDDTCFSVPFLFY